VVLVLVSVVVVLVVVEKGGRQYENSTHFIRLPLSKVETTPLQYYTTHQKTP
jgi:hypothetical protein